MEFRANIEVESLLRIFKLAQNVFQSLPNIENVSIDYTSDISCDGL